MQAGTGPDAILSTEPRASEPLVLNLALYPHRALSPTGFVVLMSAIAGLSFTIGLVAFLLGAWPVVGFLGLDVALVYVAFRLNYRDARAFETIRLTSGEMEIVKVDPAGGSRRIVLPSAWLAVEWDRPGDLPNNPRDARRPNRLTLRSRGRRLEIGAFLSTQEKDGLADVLRDGLRRAALAPHLTGNQPG